MEQRLARERELRDQYATDFWFSAAAGTAAGRDLGADAAATTATAGVAVGDWVGHRFGGAGAGAAAEFWPAGFGAIWRRADPCGSAAALCRRAQAGYSRDGR